MTTGPDPCGKCGRPHRTPHGHPSCTGHKTRTGDPCGNPPITGLNVCRVHGGAARQARAAGRQRAEEAAAARELARLGRPVEIHPSDALLDLVHWTAGEVQFWRARVVELADDDESALTWGEKSQVHKTSGQWPGTDTTSAAAPNVAYAMLTDASNRLADYCARALKAGVEERRVRLAEQQGDMVATAIRGVLDAFYAVTMTFIAKVFGEMTAEARDAFRQVWTDAITEIVPAQLRLIAGGQA